MSWYEGLRGALQSLGANKLRAGLTMLGIIIGIASVIAVVTIGMGGKAAIAQEMNKVGVNLFILYPKSNGSGEQKAGINLSLLDVESLKRALPQVNNLVPSSIEYTNVQVNQKKASSIVVGTDTQFAEIRNRKVSNGRFFSEEETNTYRRVIVVDNVLAEKLFGAGNPIGQYVFVQNVPCKVVGILAKDESPFAQFQTYEQNVYAYIPWGTWTDIFGSRRIDQLEGSTIDKADISATIESATRILNQRHGTTDGFDGFNMEQMVQTAESVTKIITSVISLVAGISLVVGGIGIMNIMLVSVTERTREIGLRKALGAKEKDILIQFLFEAVLIAVIGGFLGIALGSSSALLVANILKWPQMLSGWAIVIAVSFSVIVGVFFGYYPAYKAAKLEPMAALRIE